MIADSMVSLVKGSSVIRAMFEEGNRLAKIYGRENVYDFSLGNPNVPAPKEVNEAIKEVVDNEESTFVHGYMSNAGYEDVSDVKYAGGFLDAALDLLLRSLAELQAERHVVEHRHVRVQSVVLEHHRDVAVLRSDVVDQLVADEEFAFGDLFQTGDHAQGGGLAAAGRSDEDQEFLVLDLKAEVADGRDAARIFLVNVLQG